MDKDDAAVSAIAGLPASQEDTLWYKDAVIYQLHVKSFFDGNDDGIGDFVGLMQKLDYIVELGADTVWLLPFYPSPRRDDGYDIAEYTGVHPDYGDVDDARAFVEAAHARGLRVVTELVINHTSDQHPWFQQARAAPAGSAERNFYVWSDTDTAYAETRIIFCDTEKSNWTWDPVANAYFWHRFYSHQPDLNFDNPEVLERVLKVMDFWLEIGIDGLRLDAVPYLVEREGTSNENLPETHAVLKRIRAHMDAHFPGRMLLAEANMWPEDAQQYFGDVDEKGAGDECQMAFHFPLMPRMYMAIAREDRHPITDIMRQTPDIPDNCQWAIFLRNHDELTLEMVTSRERDYLWETYAADRRARINLGIRRRLAPLMERDRRRIELMNSLLLSMPGTPVLYYGDEIGMGDNIHLGDRDGVRTPMQWTPDRNGGFSRADPEQLVLPAIRSPLYGYEAVNVETHRRDPHSLLNWTRRVLALRRQHRAFSRGGLRFLSPGNRKILAYVREHEGDAILCVANLARTPQAVELDLSAYEGRVPVELMGNTSFPAIGQLTYLLTLPPHGFYWFQLSTEASPPDWHTVAPEQMPEMPTLVLTGRLGWELTANSRAALESEVLPAYLVRRRWFPAKGDVIRSIRFRAVAALPASDDVFLTVLETTLEGRDGSQRSALFQLPLTVLWNEEDELPVLARQLALARVRRGPRIGALTDAFSLERFARGVLAALRGNEQVAAGDGRFEFRGEAGIEDVELDEADIRWLSAEQSNSSLLIGDRAMLKVVRAISDGIHPEAEMTRHLARVGYGRTAALLGEVVHVAADGTPQTLVVVQRALSNQGDGWQWMLDALRRLVDATAIADDGVDSDQADLAMQQGTRIASALGSRLAELHAVLSLPSRDEAFAPRPAESRDVTTWSDDALSAIDRALDVLTHVREWPDAASREEAEWLIAHRDDLARAVRHLAEAGHGALLTRTHGDFHLGQTLISQDDVYLIDFEGEPVQTLERRRRKTSGLRDVAGLLRSFDYAVETVRDQYRESAGAGAPDLTGAAARREAALAHFREAANDAFLTAYLQSAGQAEVPWFAAQAARPLVDLFLMEKAAYEVSYEAGNRPTWLGIPLRGLASIARRLLDAPEPGGSAGQRGQRHGA